jgi:hypothetical protein
MYDYCVLTVRAQPHVHPLSRIKHYSNSSHVALQNTLTGCLAHACAIPAVLLLLLLCRAAAWAAHAVSWPGQQLADEPAGAL